MLNRQFGTKLLVGQSVNHSNAYPMFGQSAGSKAHCCCQQGDERIGAADGNTKALSEKGLKGDYTKGLTGEL